MNAKKLKKLADYLYQLPVESKTFCMKIYSDKTAGEIGFNPECGAVACAIGHSFSAGVVSNPGKVSDWTQVEEQLLGRDLLDQNCMIDDDSQSFYDRSDLWYYLFSDTWYAFDNSAKGVAERIYKVLKGFRPTAEDFPWNGGADA